MCGQLNIHQPQNNNNRMTLVFDTKHVTINYCIKNTKHCQQTCYPPDLQCISYKLLALKRENQIEQQAQISRKKEEKQHNF